MTSSTTITSPPEPTIKNDKILEYMSGFGNDFETEALPDALPQGKIARKSVTMAYTESNCRVLHLPPQVIKMKELGVIEFDHP